MILGENVKERYDLYFWQKKPRNYILGSFLFNLSFKLKEQVTQQSIHHQ